MGGQSWNLFSKGLGLTQQQNIPRSLHCQSVSVEREKSLPVTMDCQQLISSLEEIQLGCRRWVHPDSTWWPTWHTSVVRQTALAFGGLGNCPHTTYHQWVKGVSDGTRNLCKVQKDQLSLLYGAFMWLNMVSSLSGSRQYSFDFSCSLCFLHSPPVFQNLDDYPLSYSLDSTIFLLIHPSVWSHLSLKYP